MSYKVHCALQYLARNFILRLAIRNFVSVIPKYQRHCWMVSFNWLSLKYVCSVFRRLRDLTANVLLTKRDVDNRAKTFESRRGIHHSKISWTLVRKRVRAGPEFLPICSILFRCQFIAHALKSPTANLNETALGFSASQTRTPKKILTWQWHHVCWP